MKIPKDILDKISEIPLIDILSKELSFKKRGGNYVACCPIHSEKTPSFTLSPARNTYKCFGCGAGGDAISFFMKRDGMSFPEAVEYLCNSNGIEFRNDDKESPELLHQRTLYSINQAALDLMRSKFPGSVSEKRCLDRGISPEMMDRFQIAHASPLSQDIVKHLREAGFRDEDILASGIARQYDGKLVNLFKERTVFPIHSAAGKVIGFSARRNNDQHEPKYINTPETKVFSKGRELYGLFQAKSSIISSDEVYVVEGQTDVIAMHQAGITNTVATLGTSMTKFQALSLKRFTQNITLVYDGDAAGLKAIFRACEILFSEGLNVSIALLSSGDDPDSHIRAHGADSIRAILDAKKNFIELKASMLTEHVSDKLAVAKEIQRVISLHPDQVSRAILMNEFYQKFGIGKKEPVPVIRKRQAQQQYDTQFHMLRVMLSNWATYDFASYFTPDRQLYTAHAFASKEQLELFEFLMDHPDTSVSDILHGDNMQLAETVSSIVEADFMPTLPPDLDLEMTLTQFTMETVERMERDIRSGAATYESPGAVLRRITKMKLDLQNQLNECVNRL